MPLRSEGIHATHQHFPEIIHNFDVAQENEKFPATKNLYVWNSLIKQTLHLYIEDFWAP